MRLQNVKYLRYGTLHEGGRALARCLRYH